MRSGSKQQKRGLLGVHIRFGGVRNIDSGNIKAREHV